VPAWMDATSLTASGFADASVVGTAANQWLGESIGSEDNRVAVAGELNGDGYGDFLVGYRNDPSLGSSSPIDAAIIPGPLSGVYPVDEWPAMDCGYQGGHGAPHTLADLTGDGLDEVWNKNTRDGRVTALYWSESGMSSLCDGDWEAPADSPLALSGDISSDGLTDLVVMERSRGGEVWIDLYEAYLNDEDLPAIPTGGPRLGMPHLGWVSAMSSFMFLGHADADGHLDMMVVTGNAAYYDPVSGSVDNAGVTSIVLGPITEHVGTDIFAASTTQIRGGAEDIHLGNVGYAFADVNGDGLNDPVLSGNRSYLFYSPLPEGALTHEDRNAVFIGESDSPRVWSVGDLNGDGRGDLMFGGSDGRLFYGQPTE
jgi:hypothetical protein